MIDVWLVRHGEAVAGWDEDHDPGLSALGHRQAESAARRLDDALPQDVMLLSSPKARAIETGRPFADLRDARMTEMAAFTEVHAPVPLSERKQWLREFMRQTWSEQPDSLWAWRRDMLRELHALQRPSVVFTHFLVINAVLAECYNSDKVLLAWPANTSVHHFRLNGAQVELVSLGQQMESVVN